MLPIKLGIHYTVSGTDLLCVRALSRWSCFERALASLHKKGGACLDLGGYAEMLREYGEEVQKRTRGGLERYGDGSERYQWRADLLTGSFATLTREVLASQALYDNDGQVR